MVSMDNRNEAGDQKYTRLFTLPSESIVYAQPKLVYKSEIRYPITLL